MVISCVLYRHALRDYTARTGDGKQIVIYSRREHINCFSTESYKLQCIDQICSFSYQIDDSFTSKSGLPATASLSFASFLKQTHSSLTRWSTNVPTQ